MKSLQGEVQYSRPRAAILRCARQCLHRWLVKRCVVMPCQYTVPAQLHDLQQTSLFHTQWSGQRLKLRADHAGNTPPPLLEDKRIDVEVGVVILVLIAVDEFHHLPVSTFPLLDAHLAAPLADGILNGVK